MLRPEMPSPSTTRIVVESRRNQVYPVSSMLSNPDASPPHFHSPNANTDPPPPPAFDHPLQHHPFALPESLPHSANANVSSLPHSLSRPHNLNEPRSASRFSKSKLDSYGTIRLLDSRGAILDTIAGDVEDAFSLEPFECMILARSSARKSFILAAVLTRDKDRVDMTSTSYYDAFAINRLLFKQTGFDVVHRYHPAQPICVLNPLTQTPIMGEVKYYMVDPVPEQEGQQSLDQDQNHKNNNNANANANPNANCKTYEARFIGTDYNFAFSEALRAQFIANVFEPQDEYVVEMSNLLSRPPEHRVDFNIDMDLIRAAFNNSNNLNANIARPNNAAYKRVFAVGVAWSFYVLVTFAVVIKGIDHLITDPTGNSSNDWWWSFWPPIAFIVDRLTALLFNVREHRYTTLFKFLLWVLYYLFPTVTFVRNSGGYHLSRNILDVVPPILGMFLSAGQGYLLAKTRPVAY